MMDWKQAEPLVLVGYLMFPSHATLYRGRVHPRVQELLRPEHIGTRDFPRCLGKGQV